MGRSRLGSRVSTRSVRGVPTVGWVAVRGRRSIGRATVDLLERDRIVAGAPRLVQTACSPVRVGVWCGERRRLVWLMLVL
jgi:hypothetical protein